MATCVPAGILHEPVWRIAKFHMPQFDIATRMRQRKRVFLIFGLGRFIQDFKHALRACHSGLKIVVDIGDLYKGPCELAHIEQEAGN